MIPKIIHYCWFGRGEKPELAKKCIASWRKFCPDFEIREWNEDNFDIHCCPYVEEAYASKKYAFVTDYVRLYAMYNVVAFIWTRTLKLCARWKSFCPAKHSLALSLHVVYRQELWPLKKEFQSFTNYWTITRASTSLMTMALKIRQRIACPLPILCLCMDWS